ncbi:MAG: AAA family ATPase [Deltaproteobacteria bacterium]|nr:AAA family ATPase [Deltaproteobacteria bacterium]
MQNGQSAENLVDVDRVGLGYLAVDNEEEVFQAAWKQQLPILLKGPTGVGKTRFVEHMAGRLGRPLISVPCHEDLTAADLVGRYILKGGETIWLDGPLTEAVRQGAICYLDEVVEARSDTIVVLHPLTDHRRELHIERLGQTLHAPEEFMIVMSYNPGYQTLLKDLKPSTRQRMVAMNLDFPPPEVEKRVLTELYQVDDALADDLVKMGNAIRRLDAPGLSEVASTRALVSAALLVREGLAPREAAIATIAVALTDDRELAQGLTTIISTYLDR